MTIYIPQHLHQLEIIQTLVKMLQYYEEHRDTSSEEIENFDQLYYLYSLDPVKRFIEMCITEVGEDQDYDTVINYYVNKFYHCKGTQRVLQMMEEALGITFESDPIYNNSNIVLQISEIKISNISTWSEALKDFLDHLLYYDQIQMTIENLRLQIQDTTEGFIGNSLILYKKFKLRVL